jgi:signal transduction histidine kinase
MLTIIYCSCDVDKNKHPGQNVRYHLHMQTCLQDMAMLALNALPQAIVIADAQGVILMRNSAGDLLLPQGAAIQAVLRCGDFPALDWPGELAQLAESAGRLEHKGMAINGRGSRQLVADVSIHQISDQGQAYLVSIDDASGRLSLERRLSASQRLAAIGELAAKVAHDLNNPLDGVCRYVGLAQRTTGPQSDQYLESAKGGLKRMAGIIRQLLDQGNARCGMQHSPLGQLLAEACHAMQPAAQAGGITINCQCADLISPADGQLFQVFCNIIKNAIDAMPEGGTLTISHSPAGLQVELQFTDTGVGIPQGQAEKIFEPFYTTKQLGKGTGLGLAICRQIVGSLGGTILAGNAPGTGAIITIRLPQTPTHTDAADKVDQP